MAKLTLYKDNCVDYTVVSNLFIDQYMGNANDAQLKVYLYLIRMLSAGKATSVSDIADKFNHTEKDVMRSLRYWEKQGILALEYDQSKNLVGIHVNSLSREKPEDVQPQQSKPIVLSSEVMAPFAPVMGVDKPQAESRSANSIPQTPIQDDALRSPKPLPQNEMQLNALPTGMLSKNEPQADSSFSPDATRSKPVYTTEQLKEFRSRKSVKQLLMVAEKYFCRPLTTNEMQTIFFFMDTLHFSDDLIIALLEYCIDRGKKDFKYIEKVAVNWAQEGITTPEEAQQSVGKYSKNVYTIMNELGKSSAPTSKEMEYINRWTKEYGFSMELILEACQRTVLATDRHRLEYADTILTSWKQDNVTSKTDVLRMDELHQKKKASAKTATKPVPGKFGQFSQNDYDFDALAKQLISN